MIQKKQFGRTGHESTRTLFGAVALDQRTREECDSTLEMLLEYGVNHIDVAAEYGNAELQLAPWLKSHRSDFFLATKTSKRTYQEAKDELHRSLERMGVDHVDLWQMHYLVNPEQWEIAMGPGGALEAFIEAKEEGLVRFLGVTGHWLAVPRMHLRSLERYDFDSVLLPYNYVLMQNETYAAEFNQLMQVCLERNVAVQTIKSIARGPLGDREKLYSVWYDPLTREDAIYNAIHWVLGNENVFLNTAGDIGLLKIILEAAAQYEGRPDDAVMQADLENNQITPLFIGDEE